MPHLVFAFRVGAKGFFSRAIRFVTKSEDGISHVEVLFPDGLSFSSREPKGTSWLKIDYAADPGGWIRYAVEVTQDQLADAVIVAETFNGLPYDFLGILRLYVVKNVENQRQFCSEIGTRLAHAVGLARSLNPNLTSPQRLKDAIADNERVRRI